MSGSMLSRVRRDPTGDLICDRGGELRERGHLFGRIRLR
jgi:hypothetical protein